MIRDIARGGGGNGCQCTRENVAVRMRMWLALNSAHQGYGFLGAQGNCSTCDWWNLPNKVNEMAKQAKNVNLIREVAKNDNKIFQIPKKVNNTIHVAKTGQNTAETISLAQFLVRQVRQSCANSAQRCPEFSTSVWEGVLCSGWKFSILVMLWTCAQEIAPFFLGLP